MTLTETVKRWIDQREINRAPSTIYGYRTLLRKYIEPSAAGDMPIEDLDESDMIELLRPLIVRGCTRQAQLLQILVAAVLKDACRRRWIPWNPMDGVERIRHQSQLTPWLTVDQARKLLQSARIREDPLYIAWVLMLCCGLRRGEMLGLRWTDIDFDQALLRVQRQRIRIAGDVLTTRLKSRSSAREIPLDEHILALLRLGRGREGFVLEGVTDRTLQIGLDRALQAAGVPRVTLHGLRHTMASVAAGEAVSIKILQGLMGHAHFSTTADIYAHVDQVPRLAAARTIAGTLLGARLEIV